ncbi:MAG TPA: hypothetical protein VN450_08385 [Candidatus Methylomirabilis sp.]|nr:hypothetical protein [Candidatus Methylomirabilis sp.]
MRHLIPAGILLALVLAVAASPSTATAYSEWPAISTKVTALSTDKGLDLQCDLESHVGNIYFRTPTCDFRKFMRFMVELGHYLNETTNAGPSYILRVHFVDQGRDISISELIRFELRTKPARAADPMLLYEFFSRFEVR